MSGNLVRSFRDHDLYREPEQNWLREKFREEYGKNCESNDKIRSP
jgi:hypothetical protein